MSTSAVYIVLANCHYPVILKVGSENRAALCVCIELKVWSADPLLFQE